MIIALLGYWTPNHEVTTVSNLCSPRSSGIYPCLRLHQCKLFRFPTSEFQPLLAVNTPSFPYPSLWFSYNHFLLLLLLLLWDEEFWKSSDPFHSEEKNETRHFPLFFPFLIIITLFHRSPRKPDSNTSRQLHCSNRVDISKLFSVALGYIYASSLRRNTKRFYIHVRISRHSWGCILDIGLH